MKTMTKTLVHLVSSYHAAKLRSEPPVYIILVNETSFGRMNVNTLMLDLGLKQTHGAGNNDRPSTNISLL